MQQSTLSLRKVYYGRWRSNCLRNSTSWYCSSGVPMSLWLFILEYGCLSFLIFWLQHWLNLFCWEQVITHFQDRVYVNFVNVNVSFNVNLMGNINSPQHKPMTWEYRRHAFWGLKKKQTRPWQQKLQNVNLENKTSQYQNSKTKTQRHRDS